MKLTLAVIGTFYGRHEQSLPLFHRLFVDSTRRPDEAWLMCETQADADALQAAYNTLYDLELLNAWPKGAQTVVLPTPRANGAYSVIPYSNKINWALDRCTADLIVYLDNGSMPGPRKFEEMAAALEANPGQGAVYCTQKRTGFNETVAYANGQVADAFCALNYTQVMHRRTADRWPTDMALADPDLADGVFWRTLHKSVGVFHPAGGETIHDDHHIPSPKAAGLD